MENSPEKRRNLNRVDWALLLFALIFLIGSLLALSSDKYFRLVWGRFSGASDAAIVGQVVRVTNDVRFRDSESFTWDSSSETQAVRVGDSLFSGQNSETEVSLLDGSSIIVAESSLVTFKSLDSLQIPNLAFGNFRLKVNGRTKFSVNGQMIEVDGLGSEIEVQLKEGRKPQMRVLSGAASVSTADSVSRLASNFKSLDLPYTYDVLADEQVATKEVVASNSQTEFLYVTQVCDIYDCAKPSLMRRQVANTQIAAKVELRWAGSKQKTYLQIDSDPEFKTAESYEVPGFWKSLTPQSSHIGRNYYRFSKNGKDWGPSYQYEVKSQLLQTKTPTVRVAKPVVYQDTDGGVVRFSLEHDFFVSEDRMPATDQALSDDFIVQYLVEIHRADRSQEKLVYVKLSKSSRDQLKFTAPGKYILRARGLNKNDEVTALSAPTTVTILDSKPILLARKPPKAKKPSTFVEKAFQQTEPNREPSAVESTIKEVWKRVTGRQNQAYAKSRFSVESAGFTMFSADQTNSGSEPPFALLLGLRVQHWNGRVGVGGSFRSKVIDVTGDNAVSPTQVELRTAYRWALPFGILNNSDSQISAIAAYEIYRNGSSAINFSRGYDLFKLGMGIDLPVYNRWDTGGEILLGMGVDGSIKYEIAGFLDYYIKPEVSFGGGYRVHLFEAGSTKASPSGLPYREGFGEGYSTLRWHY